MDSDPDRNVGRTDLSTVRRVGFRPSAPGNRSDTRRDGTVLRHGNLVTSAGTGRSMYEHRTGNGIQTGSRIPTRNRNTCRNLWGRFGAARPTTDIASQYTTADKAEVTASYTSQEVTTSLSTLKTQTLPIHTCI